MHYSRRLGIFWEGYQLLKDGKPVGMVAYGQPSAPVQTHAFHERDFRLYELTRLVVDPIPNAASYLIAESLRQLSEQPAAVISYADTEYGHVGIVYQATNWLYTGAVTAHDSLYVVDGERLHPMTLRDQYGITNPVEWSLSNGVERVRPQPKHRYFTFVGSRSERRYMRGKLNYEVVSAYPKAAKVTYDTRLSSVSEADSQLSLFALG